jgi:Lantibiotic dehydratase, N terminus
MHTATDLIPTRSWLLGRRYLLRITGLPYDVMRELSFPDSIAWADRVLREQDRLAATGRRISDRLYDAVRTIEDEADRRQLLNLRRAMFGNRPPRDAAAALRLAERLGGDDGAELATWVRERAELGRWEAAGPEVLGAETGRVRLALRRIADDARLRKGLLLASPSLDSYVDGYRRAAGGKLGKRERRVERSLLEYVYRVAGKTSPFSTFTGLAVGEFGTDPVAGVYGGRVADDWTHYPRINVIALTRIADLILANDELLADLPVTLTSGWKRELDRIRYVRSTVRHGDDQDTVAFDMVRNDVYFLRNSPTMGRLLGLLEGESGLRYRDFLRLLVEAADAPPEQYDRYLRVLLKLGLLSVPALRLDALDPDPLRGFAASLHGIGTGWAVALAARLVGVAGEVDRYAHADLALGRRIIDHIRAELTAAMAGLGAADPEPPRTLIYEDSRAAPDVAVSDRDAFVTGVGEALHTIGSVLPVFDVSLAHRLTFKGFFLARFGIGGRSDDLLKLVHEFHEDLYDQYVKMAVRRRPFDENGDFVAQDNWLYLSDIDALDRARRTMVDRMRDIWAACPSDVDEIALDADFFATVAAPIAGVDRDLRPQGHFVQLGRRDGQPLAVLNRSFGGLSFPFSRFTQCFDDLGEAGLADQLRAGLSEVQPEGAVFAEVIGGTVSTNLNLHGRLTDYQLVCPGEKTALPAQCRIELNDLYVVHDPDADRLVLRSKRLDREIIPLYLGYLVPMALPEIPRTLLLLSPASLTTVDVWAGVPEVTGDSGLSVRPRVRHGNVVISRRKWTVDVSALPLRGADLTEAEWLLAWRRWQTDSGLPDQTYAKFEQSRGWTKPHFVDFASVFSLTLLDGLLRTSVNRVVFEEMLPTEEQLYVRSALGHHVAELAFEMTTLR